MADEDKQWDINPWRPITNAKDLKYLGKLGEECSELGEVTIVLNKRICRIIIQGMLSDDPTIGGTNKLNLEKEIADVLANVRLNVRHFGLDVDFIMERAARKEKALSTWHDML